MSRIQEKQLYLPAIYCIANSENGLLSTSDLIAQLRDLLKPTGEDLKQNLNRKDDSFSQKVRNLKSHDSLVNAGLANYIGDGYWEITEKGHTFLADNLPLLEYITDSGFSYDQKIETLDQIQLPDNHRILTVFSEAISIKEGEKHYSRQGRYIRSAELRKRAIEYYKVDGRVFCHVCEFDFEKIYGVLGKDFIEIHHLKPIFTYGKADIEKTLQQALKNVIPLCSNCHRMIHRRTPMLTVDELQSIIFSH